jgi:hypothetical protein
VAASSPKDLGMVPIARAFPCVSAGHIHHPQDSASLRLEAATHRPGYSHAHCRDSVWIHVSVFSDVQVTGSAASVYNENADATQIDWWRLDRMENRIAGLWRAGNRLEQRRQSLSWLRRRQFGSSPEIQLTEKSHCAIMSAGSGSLLPVFCRNFLGPGWSKCGETL